MRITDFTVRLSLRKLKDFGVRKSLVICLKDDHDRSGFGEIAPISGRSIETFDETLSIAREMGRRLLNGDSYFPPLSPSLLFGFSSALLDLTEKPTLTSFKKTHLSFENESPLPGVEHVKIKASSSFEETENRIREWLNVGAAVRVDLNEKWDIHETIAFANRFDKGDLLYIEDPVPFRTLDYFASKTHHPIAIDKTLGIAPFEMILTKDYVTHLILKPTLIGGKKQCREIAEKAEKMGKQIVYSSTYEGAIGLSHVVRMGGSQPFGVDTLKRFEDFRFPEEDLFEQGELCDYLSYFECMQNIPQ